MVYDPVAQTCLFDFNWRVDGNADDRRRLQSEEGSAAVCAASAAEAMAKSEATTKQELMERMDEMQAEIHELNGMLRQLLAKQ